MQDPVAARMFTIQRPVDAGDLYGVRSFALWRIDSLDVELQWLPLLGPTSYCLLRIFARDMDDATQIFDPITYRVADVADMLNVPRQRVLHALRRLQEFRLLHIDHDHDAAGHRAYLIDRMIPDLTDRQWRRLPESVRTAVAR